MTTMAELDALLRALVRTRPPSNGRPASPSNIRRAAWRFVHRRKIRRKRLPHPNRVRRECGREIRAALRAEFGFDTVITPENAATFSARTVAICEPIISKHMGPPRIRPLTVCATEDGVEIGVGP